MATASANVTSLQTVLAGLATGGSKRVKGTKHSGPTGIESIIEYQSEAPVYLNVAEWADTFIVTSINGLDSADLRVSAQVNPGEHGETPNDPLWGGRTVIMAGKLYAGTVWKLRDMQQGLRGSFLDIKREYPLIFHAYDPADDLMIMCKLADKINMPEQQTTKNDFVRDFQIPLRASNPRFLTVLTQRQSLTAIIALIDFTTTDYMVIEDFWQPSPTGLSTGYVQRGQAIQRGSGLLTLPSIKRNWLANPRGGGGNTLGLFSPTGHAIAAQAGGGGSVGTPAGGVGGGDIKFTVSATDPANTPAQIAWSSYHAPSVGSPYLGPPMVLGGERLRLTGYWTHQGMSGYSKAQMRVGMRVVDATGVVKSTSFLDPYVFNNDGGPSSGATGYWRYIDRTYTVPAGMSGWVQPFVQLLNTTTQWNGTADSRDLLLSAFMVDIDDGSAYPEFVDPYMAGSIAEAALNLSPSRRIWPISNYFFNPTGVKIETDGSTNRTTMYLTSSTYGASTLTTITGESNPATGGTDAFSAKAPAAAQAKMGFTGNAIYNKGVPVTFSLYIKKSTPATPARQVELDIRWLDADDQFITSSPVVIGPDSDTYQRFSYSITPPANAKRGFPYCHWLAAPQNEAHNFGWIMVNDGPSAKRFTRIAGTSGTDPTLISGPTQNFGIAETIGPIAQFNYAIDPDVHVGDNTAWPATDLQDCTLTRVASGGAMDKDSYARLAYTGGAKANFGVKRSSGVGIAVGQDWWAASVHMRSASGARQLNGRLRFDWLNTAGALVSSNLSPITVLGVNWIEVKLEGIQAPAAAVELKLYAMVESPVTGDVLDVDKFVITQATTVGEYFDGSSEWSEWSGATDLSVSRRFYYQTVQTTRKFKDGQQTVKFKTYPTLPSVLWNEIHLGLSYLDADNQLYTGIQGGRLGIWKRDDGVLTQVALAGAFAALTANTNYWVRGRLSKGVVFSEFYTSDPTVADPAPPLAKVQYTLTANEAAKWQDDTLHFMTMGVQERGAKWGVDEWHTRDVSQPEGWNWHRGAGTVVSVNNVLRPLDPTEKVFTRSGLTYKVADAKISVKLRYNRQPTAAEGWLYGGVVAKLIDKNNFIAARLSGRPVAAGGLTSLNLIQYVDGVATTLETSEIGSFAPNTDTWLRFVTAGNTFTVERWATDPVLGGAAADSILYDLSGAEIARWGAGVKGEFGIYLLPTVLDTTVDDFRFDTPSFDDIAYSLYNKGNFEAQTTFELTGPMTNPRVTNETNNNSFKINATIPVGETWVLENDGPRKRMYRKSDGANRFQYLDQTSMWIVLEPNNVPNNIRLIATALTAGWDLKVSFRHTYM